MIAISPVDRTRELSNALSGAGPLVLAKGSIPAEGGSGQIYPVISRGSIVSRPDGRPQIHLVGRIVPEELYRNARLFVNPGRSLLRIYFRHYALVCGRDTVVPIAEIEKPVQWWMYVIGCVRFIDVIVWSELADPESIRREDIQNFFGCVRNDGLFQE